MKTMPGSRVLIALLISSSFLICAPLARATPDMTSKWRRGEMALTLRQGPGLSSTWRINRDERLGTVSALFPPEGTHLPTAGDEARAGEAWFELNRAELGLTDRGALRFVSRRDGARTRHLFFEQTYDGVPVEGGGYTVSLLADGRISLILGRIVPINRVVNHAVLDRRAVGRFAMRAVKEAAGEGLAEESGRLLVRNGEARHAVRVTVPVAAGQARTLDLDAETGAVLQTLEPYDFMTGSGNVYDFNPTGPLVTHDLPRLLEPGDRLTGQFVDVRNADGPNVSGSGGAFLFAATDTESVAQVNAYYHIDRLVAYLRSLGFSGPATPIVANINTTTTNLGEFDPQTKSVNYHKQTPGLGNAALDAGVLAHEVGHYVVNTFGLESAGAYSIDQEPTALQEGLGDYFAGTYTNNPILYQWAKNCVEFPFQPLARLDTDKSVFNYAHYNNVNACGAARGDPHANGLILGGALWDLRGYVGAARADALLLKALAYCPRLTDFGCLFEALWQADVDYFNFEDALNILHSELDRGIHCVPVVTITGPLTAFVGAENRYTAGMKCPVRPTGFTWSTRHYCSGSPCEDWQEVGWDPTFFVADTTSGSLDVKVVSLDDGGKSDTDMMHVNVYYPLTATITGPTELQACVPGTYCVTVSGHGPFTYQWTHNGGNITGATGTCAQSGDLEDFTIGVKVTDADGQQRAFGMHVTVTGICPPDAVVANRGVEFVRVEGGSGDGRLGIVLSAPSSIEAEVSLFDVAGRRVGASWEGMLRPGTQRIDLGAGAPGRNVYFYRIVTAGSVRKGSAVLLR